MPTASVETKPTIEPGLKGTLPPKEYATKTMPSWGQVYLPSIANYRDMDYVSITFATDADKAAALIPKELQLVKIPLQGQSAANLVFAKYRECDLGPYMEVIVSIPVLHKGQVYLYIPAIYVDNDAALLAGRELGGYPKKMAQITMRNYGDLFLSQMSRGPIQKKTEDPNFSDLASSNVTKGSKLFSVPLSADKTAQLPPPYNALLPQPPPTGKPQDYVLPTMALRRVPGIGAGPAGAAGAEVLQLVGTPWHVTNAEFYACDAAGMELYQSEEDPIGRLLPCNSVLGAYVLRGDMYTDAAEWTLVEDLKKNNEAVRQAA
jgi:Acetoacetate decarboxylase (ADC)